MIENYLMVGKQNATPARQLANLVGCKSVRELQQLIAEERGRGVVVLSTCRDGGGYFLPSGDRTEVLEFIQTLENRGNRTLAALESARNYLKYLEAGN